MYSTVPTNWAAEKKETFRLCNHRKNTASTSLKTSLWSKRREVVFLSQWKNCYIAVKLQWSGWGRIAHSKIQIVFYRQLVNDSYVTVSCIHHESSSDWALVVGLIAKHLVHWWWWGLLHCMCFVLGFNMALIIIYLLFRISTCVSPVDWEYRICWLHFYTGVRLPPNECPRYDTKSSDSMAPVQDIWGNVEYPFIAITPRFILTQSVSTCW